MNFFWSDNALIWIRPAKKADVAVIIWAALGSHWPRHLARHLLHTIRKVVTFGDLPGIPKRLHIACAFTIYFTDVICKLEWLLRTSARNNSAKAHDSLSPGEPQSYSFWTNQKVNKQGHTSNGPFVITSNAPFVFLLCSLLNSQWKTKEES